MGAGATHQLMLKTRTVGFVIWAGRCRGRGEPISRGGRILRGARISRGGTWTWGSRLTTGSRSKRKRRRRRRRKRKRRKRGRRRSIGLTPELRKLKVSPVFLLVVVAVILLYGSTSG